MAASGRWWGRLECEAVAITLAEVAEEIRLDGEPVPHLGNMLRGFASLPLSLNA